MIFSSDSAYVEPGASLASHDICPPKLLFGGGGGGGGKWGMGDGEKRGGREEFYIFTHMQLHRQTKTEPASICVTC